MIKISLFSLITRFDLARTLAGKGRYWTTCYLVDGMMVDTGCAHTAEELTNLLEETRIIRITNTHTHEDHIGSNGLLQRKHPNIEIFAHPLALPVLSDPRKTQPLHPYRRIFWGWPQPSHGIAVSEGDEIKTNSFCFQVIYTPGHAQDHICIYEPDRQWLFSGDLFVGGRDKALRAGYDIWQIIESLKKITAFPISVLFPGSARVREKPYDELQSKIGYLEEMGNKVIELDQQGYRVSEIAHTLFGKPGWIECITLGHFSRIRLVLSYLRKNQEE